MASEEEWKGCEPEAGSQPRPFVRSTKTAGGRSRTRPSACQGQGVPKGVGQRGGAIGFLMGLILIIFEL